MLRTHFAQLTASLNAITEHAAQLSPGSVPALSILDPRWLSDQVEAAARRYRCQRPPVLGVLWWYSASLVLLGPPVDPLVRTGIAADPVLENMTLVLHPDGMVLDARATGDVVVADLAVWGRRLRDALTVSIDAVVSTTTASSRALWAVAADSVANRVLWAGGDPTTAGRLASAVGPTMPAPRFEWMADQWVVRRSSCCLLYQVPSGVKCISCPRQVPEVRRQRLRAALSGQGSV